MRAKILLFTVPALVCLGQGANLVGLPEYGVTLSGSPDNPVIEKQADQTVIGHALRVYFANGNLPLTFANLRVHDIWEGLKGLEPNRTETPFMKYFDTPQPSATFSVRGTTMHTPVKVVLDSVVFANGQMVGPDITKNFAPFATRVEALKELATFALEAR